MARRYGIDRPLLYRWKRDLVSPAPDPVFLPVTISDEPETAPSAPSSLSAPIAAPIVVERSSHEVEVELTGGRRIRFGRDTDLETVRSMVAMLDGAVS